jgi:hypothetical protein
MMKTGLAVSPRSFSTMIMWPVDETGRNSVIPSTSARMIAETIFQISWSMRGTPQGR